MNRIQCLSYLEAMSGTISYQAMGFVLVIVLAHDRDITTNSKAETLEKAFEKLLIKIGNNKRRIGSVLRVKLTGLKKQLTKEKMKRRDEIRHPSIILLEKMIARNREQIEMIDPSDED